MDHLNSLYQLAIICMLAWSLTTTGVLSFAIENELVEYCTDTMVLELFDNNSELFLLKFQKQNNS